jgi:hypothetical protein
VARSGGGELEKKVGQRKKERGKKRLSYPAPLFIPRAVVVGAVEVLHYPDSFCAHLPRGGTMWGGCLNNRATRHVMAVIATVTNDSQ